MSVGLGTGSGLTSCVPLWRRIETLRFWRVKGPIAVLSRSGQERDVKKDLHERKRASADSVSGSCKLVIFSFCRSMMNGNWTKKRTSCCSLAGILWTRKVVGFTSCLWLYSLDESGLMIFSPYKSVSDGVAYEVNITPFEAVKPSRLVTLLFRQ